MEENENKTYYFEKDYNKLDEYDKNLFPMLNPVSAAFLALFGVFILYQIVGSLLTLAIFGFDIKNADTNSMRLMTMAGQFLFILVPAIWLSKAVYFDVSTVLRVRRLPRAKEFGLAILGLVILTPLLQLFINLQNYAILKLAEHSALFNGLKSFLDNMDKIVESSYLDILSTHNIVEVLLVIVVVTLTPAICEEAFFRGFVQKSFELKMKPFWAILITSIFFGLYHFNPYGLLSLIFLSMFLGWFAYKGKSIFLPMTIHFLNNLFAVVMYLIYGKDELVSNPDISNIDLMSTLGEFTFLLVLFIIFFIYAVNYYKNLEKS
jgi:membrane protease YdiL (CAAX protease family)